MSVVASADGDKLAPCSSQSNQQRTEDGDTSKHNQELSCQKPWPGHHDASIWTWSYNYTSMTDAGCHWCGHNSTWVTSSSVYLTSISNRVMYWMAQWVLDQRTMNGYRSVIVSILQLYVWDGFKVQLVCINNTFRILLKPIKTKHGFTTNFVAAGEHAPHAEHNTHIIQEQKWEPSMIGPSATRWKASQGTWITFQTRMGAPSTTVCKKFCIKFWLTVVSSSYKWHH